MSGLSVIHTNLHCTLKLLRPYIRALWETRSRGGSTERADEVQIFLAVLAPMCLQLRGKSYFKLGFNGEEMTEFLRRRHREEWPRVRDGILAVTAKLENSSGPRVDLTSEEMSILGDMEAALDDVCSSLYRKTHVG